MALERLGRFISELLEGLPEDDPERRFLENEAARVRNRLTPQDEKVASARREIQRLVDADIKKRGPVLTGGTLLLREENLIRGNERFGPEYVGNLLTVECHVYFSVVNRLVTQSIFTKSDLIKLSVSDIMRIPLVGHKRATFIRAMRELAIAEKNITT